MTESNPDVEVSRLRARLTELALERTALESRLAALARPSRVSEGAPAPAAGTITDASTPEEKLTLFRSLFAGRPDVSPVRWENSKSGRSGYAPACANEWVRGVCDKPTIKCGACGNQAFIPVSLDTLARHLRGREGAKAQGAPFVVGVYPLLSDDTCWFLAADFDDEQWAFLSGLPRTARAALTSLVRAAEQDGRILGVRMPVDDEKSDQPWLMLPSRRHSVTPLVESLPSHVDLVLADGIYIDRTDLPPVLVALLIRLAAFQNPEFYRAQAMRMSTHGKPRIIACAELHPRHVALPRGCFDEALALLRSYQVEARVEDRREMGEPLPVRFLGTLREEQAVAFDALAAHDFGVLAASPAFGKTVVAAALIAKRACSTLVLVHRRELLTQWVERLREFLSVEPGDIGTIAGGRKKPTRRIDVAVIQSLVRKGEVSDLVAGYGQLIVDECHHLSAASFELAARRSKARYVVGLSATVARRDGHQTIIFMQCGPVRHRIDPGADALRRGIAHRVVLRETAFRLDTDDSPGRVSVPRLYARLALDGDRNALIVTDVKAVFAEGRTALVLTERRDHVEILRHAFEQFTQSVVVLQGGMKPGERRAAGDQLRASRSTSRIILATGRYLGEGFDDPRLDTLFIAMPIAWKGTLQQYVGRLHRDHDGKRDVVVYDYADVSVPVLARMAAKRQTGYRALGYVAWSDR